MSYAIAFGHCLICRQPFGFNPLRVPSFRVNGEREPICSGCFERINVIRAEKGLPLNVQLPSAYEPCEEGELDG